jgi:hypothetical protein
MIISVEQKELLLRDNVWLQLLVVETVMQGSSCSEELDTTF